MTSHAANEAAVIRTEKPIRTGYSARALVRERISLQREVTRSEVMLSTARKLLSLWLALARARTSEERLLRFQARQLRRVVRDAATHVPLYSELWGRAGVDPRSIRTRDDLPRLPIIEKDDVRDRFPEGSIRTGTQLQKCRIQQTSGSSGQCMEIALSMRCDDMRNIYSQRIYGWHGFRWYTTAAYLFPYRLPFENNLAIYRNEWIDAKQESDTVLDRLERVRPEILAATPSDILDLLEGMRQDRDLSRIGLRALCLHSEPMSADERVLFESIFGCPVFTNYYCNEVWAIAAECEHGQMHEFIDNVILEIVNERGELVPDGEPGEAIVTGLSNFVQPFIRYRLGDVVVRRRKRGCACGRQLPILECIEGRSDDVLLHPDGRRIRPSKITVAAKSPCFARPGLQIYRDYQIVRDATNHITLRVVPGRDSEDLSTCLQESRKNLHDLLAPDFGVDVEIRRVLPAGAGGKRKIFIDSMKQESE